MRQKSRTPTSFLAGENLASSRCDREAGEYAMAYSCFDFILSISHDGSIILTSGVSIFQPTKTGSVSVISVASDAVALFERSLARRLHSFHELS